MYWCLNLCPLQARKKDWIKKKKKECAFFFPLMKPNSYPYCIMHKSFYKHDPEQIQIFFFLFLFGLHNITETQTQTHVKGRFLISRICQVCNQAYQHPWWVFLPLFLAEAWSQTVLGLDFSGRSSTRLIFPIAQSKLRLRSNLSLIASSMISILYKVRTLSL